MRDNERIVLLYVEHTSIFDRITGVQRVCYKLAAMLEAQGETVLLVKLDSATLSLAPLNLEERSRFIKQSGRQSDDRADMLYDPGMFDKMMELLRNQARVPWIIIPEVTYHTTHVNPPTSRLVKVARNFGLRVGVIFYDVIPFLVKDAAENALKHADYMSSIALVDVIWPISHYSSDLMLDYYQRHETMNDSELPVISVATLAEEMDTPRQTKSASAAGRNIVCVGTIDERKNQITLIRAFNKFCKAHPGTDWKLHVIGLVRDSYKKIIEREASKNNNITFHYNASDEDIKQFYMNCNFTVFPSLEEGYGLPVVESLWNLRPCICAAFSSMAELQDGGGCLAINTRSVDEVLFAITSLMVDENLYQQKIDEIIQRPVKTWYEYAGNIVADMDRQQFGKLFDNPIYYWIDATLTANSNSGIQRVNRQLARALLTLGHKLVPVKWDEIKCQIALASKDDLNYLARWNGPARGEWHMSFDPEQVDPNATYLMSDLPLNRPLDVQRRVIKFFKQSSVNCAAIFYDAIPYKLQAIYPPHFSAAHQEYMEILDGIELIIPISTTSASDLTNYLNLSACRGLALEDRIKVAELPSEFPEIERTLHHEIHDQNVCNILVVGTVEPRKNHDTLIRAFFDATQKSERKLTLTMVGGDESFDKELPHKIKQLIGNSASVIWIKNASDDVLRDQYEKAEFTVFPSTEEGFGLPIVESLWFGIPCICSQSGQMAELASHGGCEMIDVLDVKAMSNAILNLANNFERLTQLKQQIFDRHFKTWEDYAAEVSASIRSITQTPSLPVTSQSARAPYEFPSRPTLSVCITTYNRSGWLDINLENLKRVSANVLGQIEIIVCDNCSDDETPVVVNRFLDQINIRYYRNSSNVGMLGNLAQTVSFARGDYVWLIGDDDLLHQGALEKILDIVEQHYPDLINVNYAYSTSPTPPTIHNLGEYFSTAAKIAQGGSSGSDRVKNISANNENFFTAIYTFIVKRKHSQKIFNQDTSGAPFSSLQTCVPSSKYILSQLMELPGYWINEPQLTINMNVSWGKYAPIWLLERIPEVYDLAELNGVSQEYVDQWRRHTVNTAFDYLEILFKSEHDPSNESFEILRFVRRSRHLDEFRRMFPKIEAIYADALERNHPLARISMDTLQEAMRR